MRFFTRKRMAQTRCPEQPVKLIVLEEGASGFEPLKPVSETPFELAVLIQNATEAHEDLVERTIRRLHAFQRSGRAVIEAILVVGPAVGGPSLAARELVLRAISTHMADQGRGEITLALNSDARPEQRHELLELLGGLTGQLGTQALGVRLIVGQPESRLKLTPIDEAARLSVASEPARDVYSKRSLTGLSVVEL